MTIIGLTQTGTFNGAIMMTQSSSFYSIDELRKIGFRGIGINVMISRKASIYCPEKIEIKNNVRIDDFCILSGRITLGSYIHIAAYSAIYGGEDGVIIDDYANISSRVCIYSVSDDYSGASMTNPMIPDEYKNTQSGKVHIKKHVIIGSTSIVLPNVTLCEGSAFGSMSFINHDSEPWSVNVGIPFRKIKDRKRDILALEKAFEIRTGLNETQKERQIAAPV